MEPGVKGDSPTSPEGGPPPRNIPRPRRWSAMSDARDDRRRHRERWRRRLCLERQLHDGAALRISSMALRLGALDREASGSAGVLRRDIDALQDEVAAALEELRAVAGQIYPPLLHEAGLGPALRELVTARGADASLDVTADRAEPAVEGAVYFALADCLESPPGPLTIEVRTDSTAEEDLVVVVIEGADPALAPSVLDEAGPLGGTVDVATDPAAPGGTATITARFPCA